MSKFTLRALFVYVALFAILFAIASAIVRLSTTPREGVRWSACVNNLKLIGIALHSYHHVHGGFPPAYIADARGKPMHSWRVLLLPHFEDPTLHNLYKQYKFNEPWNGPNNRKLADKMPSIYRCPSSNAGAGETGYVAIIGAQTGWPNTKSLNIHEIHDGTSRTIALTEVANSGIYWLEPRDLTFGQALGGINPPLSKLSPSSAHPGGANFLFFDGSVLFLENAIEPEQFRALLTADGGEDVSLWDVWGN